MSQPIEAYSQKQSLSDNALLQNYLPLVKRIAHHMIGRLPKSVQLDDLIQAGLIGLIEAAKNFDTGKGASFETYAGIRIRGAILDEVRKNDWHPRSVYRNSRRIAEAIQLVENEVGREARDAEIAEKLQISLEEYHTLLMEVHSGQLFGFEDLGLDDDSLISNQQNSVGPFEEMQREHFLKALSQAIALLPEREKLILNLYYMEEFNLKEIGHILEVSESRICQILNQSMCRLKSRIIDWKE